MGVERAFRRTGCGSGTPAILPWTIAALPPDGIVVTAEATLRRSIRPQARSLLAALTR